MGTDGLDALCVGRGLCNADVGVCTLNPVLLFALRTCALEFLAELGANNRWRDLIG